MDWIPYLVVTLLAILPVVLFVSYAAVHKLFLAVAAVPFFILQATYFAGSALNGIFSYGWFGDGGSPPQGLEVYFWLLLIYPFMPFLFLVGVIRWPVFSRLIFYGFLATLVVLSSFINAQVSSTSSYSFGSVGVMAAGVFVITLTCVLFVELGIRQHYRYVLSKEVLLDFFYVTGECSLPYGGHGRYVKVDDYVSLLGANVGRSELVKRLVASGRLELDI